MRIALRSSGALLALATTITLAGCVESFGGSNLQIDFSQATPVPSGDGIADPVRPPADTYFTFYALDHEYDEANPDVIVLTRFYEIQRFEIQPVIQTASPCFIDLEESRYPGLHITQFAEKERERTGIDNPLDPPDGVDEGDVSDVLTADTRIDNLNDLESTIKAVVSYSPTIALPDAAAGCIVDGIGPDEIPAPTCTEDVDNEQRLRVCRDHWDDDPNFYQGSDKVFTLPNNGILYGMVEGPNPINQGFVGGATISVDEVLSGFDAFTVNWNYKDEGAQTSATGTTFVTGEPESRTRGVINARLISPLSNAVFAEVGIFSDLGDDNVNF